MSAFLANLTPPNDQSSKVKSEFKSLNHVSNFLNNKGIILFGGVNVASLCFKKLPLNIKQKCDSMYHLIDGEKVLPVVVRIVSFSVHKPLDFHDTFLVLPSLFKV